MTDEVKKYFAKRYEECDFSVVPGHWPDFKTREDVDEWIDTMEKTMKALFEYEDD